MKKSSVNTFTEGLVCDLDPINVPNNVLTDCLNGTIITYDGNEYSLQNDKGNYPLADCKLQSGFIPVGIKEYGGIIYIVSLNPLTGKEEIGSYPSPKLYDGGTPHGDLNVEYVIDEAFEEANSEELDYSELESKCKSWYYANPDLKLNVGDKFWFEDDLDITPFEKIEKYVIDENSIPHLISDDWMNDKSKYISPISGTIMLKNKIFQVANTNAETNTFTCWRNNGDEDINTEDINIEYQFVTNEDLTGTACIIYDNNGTWMSIQNPSSSNQSAITSEYDNYNSFVMQFYPKDNYYYIKVNDYYLQYDSESDTGLSFTLYESDAVHWTISISNNDATICPISKSGVSIGYNTGSIRCDDRKAGTIKLIRANFNCESENCYQLITTSPSDWSGKYVITFRSQIALNNPRSENPSIYGFIKDDLLIGGDQYAFKIEQYDSYYLISNSFGYLWYDEEGAKLELGKKSVDDSCLWSISMIGETVRISPKLNLACSIRGHNNFDVYAGTYGNGDIFLYKKEIDSDGLNSLFSFTHKLYIDDHDTLQWFTDDCLKYKVNLKVNGSIIYSNTFAGNSLISEETSFKEYKIAIESKQLTNLEWYNNNRIISKYFVTVIKNINSNDQISAEIIPIISISGSKNIIMSHFAKSLDNSVSEYISTAWNIGDSCYRFYNHPSNGEYKTQYIELDIKGPIEASDDFVLNCNIYEYNNSYNEIIFRQFTPGIGKSILQIDYNDSFVKENIYTVKYSIMLASTTIKNVTKSIITSELFNYDEFLKYNDYETIDSDTWISKYEHTITNGNVTMSIQDNKTNLSKSLYTYITENPDYVNRTIPYPNFINESDYNNYSNFKEARLSGYEYSATINIEEPSYLKGPLWTITKSSYSCTDALGKVTPTADSSINLRVPVGSGQYVNFDNSAKTVCGRIKNVEVISPKTIIYTWQGFADLSANNGKGRWWATLSDNSKVLKTFELNPPGLITSGASGKNYVTDVTEIVKSLCSFEEDLVDIRLRLIDGCDNNDPSTQVSVTANYQGTPYDKWGEEEIVITNACKSTKEWFVKIPDSTYVKINADKDEKYQSGYWCNFSRGDKINFNNPWINVSMNISVKTKINSEKEFKWEKTVINPDINFSNDSNVSSEIDNIILKGKSDQAAFAKIVENYINPITENYVKCIADADIKAMTRVTELTANYREYDTFEISSHKNGEVSCSGLLRTTEGVWNDTIVAYFGSTNGGPL